MELDALKEKWAAHDRKLDISIRLNRQLMRELYTGRARSALLRLAALLVPGSVFMLAVIVWLGAFIHQNLGKPRFVWPAVALDVFAIAALATLNLQIVLALQTDYDKPIAVIQKRLERLRNLRVRYVQGICLLTALTWMPIFIVVMKAFLGIDVYQAFDRGWLVWNVVFGLAVIPLGIWLAIKYGGRMNRPLAGYNLNAASGFLATLSEFEKESSST